MLLSTTLLPSTIGPNGLFWSGPIGGSGNTSPELYGPNITLALVLSIRGAMYALQKLTKASPTIASLFKQSKANDLKSSK